MIYEELMGWGRFSVPLHPEAPVWDLLDPSPDATNLAGFGHIVITPVPLDPANFDDAAILAAAIYTGVYYGTSDRHTLTGHGLAAHLTDPGGVGIIHETAINGTDPTSTYAVRTFRAWVMDALALTAGGLGPITEGTLANLAGTWGATIEPPAAAIDALDLVMDRYSAEWRINPDGTLDAGTSLFVTSPQVAAIYDDAGHDPNLVGLRDIQVNVGRLLDDWSSKVVLSGAGGLTGTATIGSNPFSDLHGNALVRKRLVSAPQAGADLSTLAAAQLGRFDDVKRAYQLTTADPGVRNVVEAGDTIWVYDPRPDAALADLSNQVSFRGRVIFPVGLRVVALEWPLLSGMGVLFRNPDGVYTDLTRYVAWEGTDESPADTTLHVGYAPRGLSDTAGSGVVAPTVTAGGELGYAETTGTDTGIGAGFSDLTGLSVTVMVGTSRRIRITGKLQVAQRTSAGTVRGAIREGSTALQDFVYHTLQTNEVAMGHGSVIITPSAGAHTYKLSLLTNAGTVDTVSGSGQRANFIQVEDLGPA